MQTQSNDNEAVPEQAADPLGAAFALGVQCMQGGDKAGAIAAFRAALALAPQLVAAHVNLGLLLERHHPAQAEAQLRAAVAADPFSAVAAQHLGALLAAQKRFEEAEQIYRAALALEPEAPALLSNLGVLLACTGREGQAMACYRAALALVPDFSAAHFNIAYLLLRDGDYAGGWRELEHRAWYASLEQCFAFPRWRGEALQGKRLLIGVEAGNGDMIQFCRYAPLAKRQGAARVGIVCHSGLKRLFAGAAGIDVVFGVEDEMPASGWDFWVPPLSLPGLFGTRLDSIPASLPYLNAVPASAAARPCLAGVGMAVQGAQGRRPLRVGLAWQGNPLFENDDDRSLPSLEVLAPLTGVHGVDGIEAIEWFSLQKGAGELGRIDPLQDACPEHDRFAPPQDGGLELDRFDSPQDGGLERDRLDPPQDGGLERDRLDPLQDGGLERDRLDPPQDARLERDRLDPLAQRAPGPRRHCFPGAPDTKITDLAPCIADFADTAALIATLDLVIAVDTAVAHLAGALGRPCWVLLPAFKPDWRWLKDRDDSPWYPRVMRLFRQQEAGRWDEPVAALRLSLQAMVLEHQGGARKAP